MFDLILEHGTEVNFISLKGTFKKEHVLSVGQMPTMVHSPCVYSLGNKW